MKIERFLEKHGIAHNPFADEDAQSDRVFKEHCIDQAYHPSWAKIYGDPSEPAAAIVFGEKGAGKTALRLQIARALKEHNRKHPDQRLYKIEYDDFNPFLDRFRERLSGRKRRPDRVLGEWRLWDHMDAILSLGVTQLIDRVLEERSTQSSNPLTGADVDLTRLDHLQRRDLLLLATCYDRSQAEPLKIRWSRLRRKLRFHTWRTYRDVAIGVVVTLVVAGLIIWQRDASWLKTYWPYLAVLAGWTPWLCRVARWTWRGWKIKRNVRVLDHNVNHLRHVLMSFPVSDISGQPLPTKDRTDDRYELLVKLQGVLTTLGFSGLFVLVDRVDEPHLINGATDQMRALLWPMLDNKFLKHPGVGLKLLLPIELDYYIEREDRDFYQRARLDKQNMIPSLEWTGEALFDVANARLRACAIEGRTPNLRELFDDSITDQRLVDALKTLRVPRNLFKFMYRLLMAHSAAHTDENPLWQIPGPLFESTLAVYQRDQDAFQRGMGSG
jgi:hypothetical protein